MKNLKLRHTRFFSLLVVEWLWLLCLLPILCIWLSTTSSIKLLDNFIYDRLLSSHVQTVDQRIVLIDIDERSLAQIGAWPWQRTTHAALLNRLSQAHPKSVLFDVIFAEPDAQPMQDQALTDALKQFEHIALPVLLLPKNSLSIDADTTFNEVLPIPSLAQSAQLGHIMAQPDSDNVLRHIKLSITTDQQSYPALAQQAALLSASNQEIRIPYIAPAGSYAHVSYVDVLNGLVANDIFEDRYVLIGASAAGLGDQYSTPFGTMTGVEIQATVLDALINQRSLKTLPIPLSWLVLVLPIVLLLIGFISLNERYQLAFLLGLFVLHVGLIAVSLWWSGVWIPPVATWVVLLLAYLLWSWRRLSAAMHYFDGEIRLIAQSPNQLRALLMHLSPSSSVSNVKTTHGRSLSALIKQVGDLQHFMTYSLLQAQPMAMLVLGEAGKIILSNQKSQSIVHNASPVTGIKDFLAHLDPSCRTWSQWRDAADYLWLNNIEVNDHLDHRVIYKIQVTPVQMDGSGQTWLLGFIDLTQEREIQRQNAELIQFLSHDLRTPQVNILSLLQLHQNDDVQMPKDKMIKKIDQNVRRTLTLAESLVFLSHAKTGDYRYMELNLAQITPVAIEQVWAQAQQKNIRLTFKPVNEEVSARCWMNVDGDLVERAIINVLTNAIRYSPEHREVTIEIKIVDQTYVACHITDQGIGMTPTQISQLMDGQRLTTESGATDIDAAGSMGIGFSMVRIIMQRHGGRVELQSTQGQGTQVALIFPSMI